MNAIPFKVGDRVINRGRSSKKGSATGTVTRVGERKKEYTAFDVTYDDGKTWRCFWTYSRKSHPWTPLNEEPADVPIIVNSTEAIMSVFGDPHATQPDGDKHDHVAAICGQLDKLTDDERLGVFRLYCTNCGGKNKPCHCTNDE